MLHAYITVPFSHSCTNPTSTSTAISPPPLPYLHLLHICYMSACTFSALISTIRVYLYTPPRIVGKEQVTRDARACEAEEKRMKTRIWSRAEQKTSCAEYCKKMRKVVTQNFGRVRVGLKSKMLSGCTCQGITHKRIRLKDKGNTYRCLHAGSSSAAPD